MQRPQLKWTWWFEMDFIKPTPTGSCLARWCRFLTREMLQHCLFCPIKAKWNSWNMPWQKPLFLNGKDLFKDGKYRILIWWFKIVRIQILIAMIRFHSLYFLRKGLNNRISIKDQTKWFDTFGKINIVMREGIPEVGNLILFSPIHFSVDAKCLHFPGLKQNILRVVITVTLQSDPSERMGSEFQKQNLQG